MLQSTQGGTTTNLLYGLDRLASQSTTAKTWYISDALSSVRATLDDTGAPLGAVTYDPWGTPESGTVPIFGFTGELQDTNTGLVNLRARWYSTAQGRFGTFRWRTDESNDFVPYTHHPYAYALSNPVLLTDRTGKYAIVERPNRNAPICSYEMPQDPVDNFINGSGPDCNQKTGERTQLSRGTIYIPGISTAAKVVVAECVNSYETNFD